MGTASVIQNPVNYYHYANGDTTLTLRFRVKASLPPAPPSKCFPSLSLVASYNRRHQFAISCSKPPGPPEAGRKSTTPQPRHDVTNLDTPPQLHHQDYASSVRTVAFWVCTAVAFGIGLGFKDGIGKASEFFAGYMLEQSLSVDNLFVFVLIFKYFKVPVMYQSRVLSYGIAGAVFFRLTLIVLGTATLQRFEAVNLLLAAILIYSSFKLFASEEDESDLSNNFVVKTCQKFIPVTTYYDGNKFITNQDGMWKATPLLLTIAVIELSDIAFAVDSIPAVFGVTRDPFIIFTSNLFAILGLRSLYTIISEGMSELEYLQSSIAVVLGFIGCKMILDYFGIHVSTEASLGFVASSLTIGVISSLAKKSDKLTK
ncbi:hypothetical protein HN51_040224 [Arachis hypogaea]|uniref:thylakoid membrane protein TERC, chloroplastic isoform X1 n=1 Tax=Arachis ipaensis TaxID=130454 RepID=UPI0007AF254E|nr:thylakoid membrane protein TERC, chloroplastic isoform X1 [Arachis ipaensis]XP_025663606.1 thylakoid membrane protein TERC, chloroplastic [Arachis hypogaea]QHN85927.1 Thylakoid membrane protein TERC [Arachis hypogaea]